MSDSMETPYLIHCVLDEDFGSCGKSSFLTKEQYNEQMARPDRGWQCPVCRCYPCDFDDVHYEKFMNKVKAQ